MYHEKDKLLHAAPQVEEELIQLSARSQPQDREEEEPLPHYYEEVKQ